MTLDAASSARLDKAGLAAYQLGPTIYQSRNTSLSSPETRLHIETVAAPPVTGNGGSLGAAVTTDVGYEEVQGTGYNPYDGLTVDSWVCTITLSPNTYYGSFFTPGLATVTGPTYYPQNPWPSINCVGASGSVIGAATAVAQAIQQNASTFANAVIKVGASSVSAVVFASSFAAAGAEITFASAAAFLLGCLAFFTAPEWIALGLLVAGLAAAIYAIHACTSP